MYIPDSKQVFMTAVFSRNARKKIRSIIQVHFLKIHLNFNQCWKESSNSVCL